MRAFPIIDFENNEDGYIYVDMGMTLRDYFAAKAMQADISNYTDSHQFGKDFWTTENFAKRAYNMADAMIKARGEDE